MQRQTIDNWRDEHGITPDADLFSNRLEQPETLYGDAVIVGDVHAPCTDYDLAGMVGPIAEHNLTPPRQLIIAGDLFNLDFASSYLSIVQLPTWRQERKAAKQLLSEWLRIFDDVFIFPGNHERRLARMTNGEMAMDDLIGMVDDDPRVVVSNIGYCWLDTITGRWRITHARNYSVVQLRVSESLSHKYNCHIINHHQHHLAIGMDRYKRHVIVDNGALVDPEKLAYVMLDDSSSGGMARGFTLIKNGVPHLLSNERGFTDWDRYLP